MSIALVTSVDPIALVMGAIAVAVLPCLLCLFCSCYYDGPWCKRDDDYEGTSADNVNADINAPIDTPISLPIAPGAKPFTPTVEQPRLDTFRRFSEAAAGNRIVTVGVTKRDSVAVAPAEDIAWYMVPPSVTDGARDFTGSNGPLDSAGQRKKTLGNVYASAW